MPGKHSIALQISMPSDYMYQGIKDQVLNQLVLPYYSRTHLNVFSVMVRVGIRIRLKTRVRVRVRVGVGVRVGVTCRVSLIKLQLENDNFDPKHANP